MSIHARRRSCYRFYFKIGDWMINNLKISLEIRITYLLEKYLKPIFNFFGLMKKIKLLLFIQILLFV
jgi:hypothetical protein